MIYLLLAFEDDPVREGLPAGEPQALDQAGIANNRVLRENELWERGYLLARGGLQSSSTTTVQLQDGELSITGVSPGKTKEQLVEFFIITAWDLNEAIRVAARMPQAQRGPVEVWPVTGFERPADFPDSFHEI